MDNAVADDVDGGSETLSVVAEDTLAAPASQRPPLPPSIPDYVVLSPLPLPLRAVADIAAIDARLEE